MQRVKSMAAPSRPGQNSAAATLRGACAALLHSMPHTPTKKQVDQVLDALITLFITHKIVKCVCVCVCVCVWLFAATGAPQRAATFSRYTWE